MMSANSSAVLAARVVETLRDRGQTLATAESLTGGLVGATITSVPGASAVYRGGLIPYATELKGRLAGVPTAVLDADGPVAPTTAVALARGTAGACGADWGIATTGVAGPDPQDGHPVGQVYVAVSGPARADLPGGDHRDTVRELALTGGRREIREQTVTAVLSVLLELLDAEAR